MEGCVIATRLRPTAMTDISDGLFSDLRKMCRASGVGFTVNADQIPIAPAARAVATSLGLDPTRLALMSGEEFELLFTLPNNRTSDAEQLAQELRLPMTQIGTILEASEGFQWLDSSGGKMAVLRSGFEHFHRDL